MKRTMAAALVRAGQRHCGAGAHISCCPADHLAALRLQVSASKPVLQTGHISQQQRTLPSPSWTQVSCSWLAWEVGWAWQLKPLTDAHVQAASSLHAFTS